MDKDVWKGAVCLLYVIGNVDMTPGITEWLKKEQKRLRIYYSRLETHTLVNSSLASRWFCNYHSSLHSFLNFKLSPVMNYCSNHWNLEVATLESLASQKTENL